MHGECGAAQRGEPQTEPSALAVGSSSPLPYATDAASARCMYAASARNMAHMTTGGTQETFMLSLLPSALLRGFQD